MEVYQTTSDHLDAQTRNFYCQALKLLNASQVPFLIGGAFAFERYTGIARPTKDLDLFVRPDDCPRILEVFAQAGYQTEMAVPHWLGKAFSGENFVDVIFRNANGHGDVDDHWFTHAFTDYVLDIPVQVCPVEEMIWSKSYVMARDRYDGADVAHMILACAERLDWRRLLDRFADHWRVLFSHLILFGFIYPGERSRLPSWVLEELTQRLQQEMHSPAPATNLCQGPLLAPLQYQVDVEPWGYQDARVAPGKLTEADVENWIEHLQEEKEF